MLWRYLFTAIALVLVLEGILPFLSPRVFRNFMHHMSARTDKALRMTGLIMMIVGVVVMYIIHFSAWF